MTTTLEAPPVSLPDSPDATCEPLATCEQVRAIMDTAARRSACKKDLSGHFALTTGSLLAGKVAILYGNPNPKHDDYLLECTREAGRWTAVCPCRWFALHGECKHCARARAALPYWRCERSDLLPLTPQDGLGTDGPCPREGCGGTMHRLSFWYLFGGIQSMTACDRCATKGQAS